MRGFRGGSAGKNPPVTQEYQETQVRSLGWGDPLRRAWRPTPVLLPGEFRGQRSLAGYSLWDRKELDRTEHAHTHTTFLVFSLFFSKKEII